MMTIKKQFLSDAEIRQRLRIKDTQVIDEVYEICQQQMQAEGYRLSVLDAKANNLSGMIGVYLSLLFGLIGLLLTRIQIPVADMKLFLALYAVAGLTALAALLFALRAAQTRSDYRTVGEDDVFKKNIISKDITIYKRYLTAHYWKIYRNNYEINEHKGLLLKKAYAAFFTGILSLTLLTAQITSVWYQKGGQLMIDETEETKPEETEEPGDGEIYTSSDTPEETEEPSEEETQTRGKS